MSIKHLYFIVRNRNASDLENDVESLLEEDWSLIGQPFIFDEQVCQAMERKV